jgi:hypothetical protein
MAATSGRPSTPFLNYFQAFVGSPSQPKPSLRCTTKQIGLRHGLRVRLWTLVEQGAYCYDSTFADSCSLLK